MKYILINNNNKIINLSNNIDDLEYYLNMEINNNINLLNEYNGNINKYKNNLKKWIIKLIKKNREYNNYNINNNYEVIDNNNKIIIKLKIDIDNNIDNLFIKDNDDLCYILPIKKIDEINNIHNKHTESLLNECINSDLYKNIESETYFKQDNNQSKIDINSSLLINKNNIDFLKCEYLNNTLNNNQLPSSFFLSIQSDFTLPKLSSLNTNFTFPRLKYLDSITQPEYNRNNLLEQLNKLEYEKNKLLNNIKKKQQKEYNQLDNIMKQNKNKEDEYKKKFLINRNLYFVFKKEINEKTREINDIPVLFKNEWNIFLEMENKNILDLNIIDITDKDTEIIEKELFFYRDIQNITK
jgi:hypothetical protein